MKGKSQAMIEQIQQSRKAGHSLNKICRALNISRNTVRRYLRGKEHIVVKQENSVSEKFIDWDFITNEIKRGRTLKNIHREIESDYSYSHFSRLVGEHVKKPQVVAIRLQHEPGEKAQVDYAKGLCIIDSSSGKEIQTQFFCGVLPFSSLTFGEFSFSQKIPDFVRSHERMWLYFGGVAKYVVLDNLKSGVSRAHRYDPDINPTYCDYCNHAGFVPLPARVRTPRDKAAVEATIGVIQRGFFDRYRDKKFYSLSELNSCFREYLDAFNHKIMPDYGCSRRERFEGERNLLKPISSVPYEFYEWKQAKVHPDSCIEHQKSVYSVPYEYVHKSVHVKYSDKLLIILDPQHGKTIAAHAKQPRFKHSILKEHLPSSKVQYSSFDMHRVRKFSEIVGPNTKEYVDWQLEAEIESPLRALRRLMGLMRFYETKHPAVEAMEYAAKQSRQFHKRNLRYFQDCALSFNASGPRIHLLKPPIREEAHIHIRLEKGD